MKLARIMKNQRALFKLHIPSIFIPLNFKILPQKFTAAHIWVLLGWVGADPIYLEKRAEMSSSRDYSRKYPTLAVLQNQRGAATAQKSNIVPPIQNSPKNYPQAVIKTNQVARIKRISFLVTQTTYHLIVTEEMVLLANLKINHPPLYKNLNPR